MKWRISLHTLIILFFIFTATMSFARDYIIFSISQDLPMDDSEVKPKKNFYINMGIQQGIKEGSLLDVYRVISRLDPYENKKRYNYKVKIGEVKILHVEEQSSIASTITLNTGEAHPLFEIKNLMIGDHVDVKLK
ncbi:MAG: hypothetical protein HN576_02250 [Bacteriovoracaceae bacterium]|nr:hypothetical protein [Bacteriovoracaceae bacterium]